MQNLNALCALLIAMLATACSQAKAPNSPAKAAKTPQKASLDNKSEENGGESDDVIPDATDGDDEDEDEDKDENGDDESDDDDTDSDEDVGSADRTALQVQVKIRRDDNATLKVRFPKGEWVTKKLVDDGEGMTLDGLCKPNGKDTKLEIAIDHPETGELRAGGQLVIAGSGSSTVTVSFDDETEGTPDDNVFTLSCGGGNIDAN